MTRIGLIKEIKKIYPYIDRVDVERIVAIVLDTISGELIAGNRVELRGFGAFFLRQRNPMKGRNPRTGEAVNVDAKKTIVFKAGKQMRALINSTTSDETNE